MIESIMSVKWTTTMEPRIVIACRKAGPEKVSTVSARANTDGEGRLLAPLFAGPMEEGEPESGGKIETEGDSGQVHVQAR